MTLVNPKPSGYATGERLPSADVNSVWDQLTDALDGAGGGTYTLTAALQINGDDVGIGENLAVGGDATVTGNIEVGDGLDVAGIGIFRMNSSTGPDSNKDYTIGDRPGFVFIPTLTSNRTYTLKTSAGVLGQWYLFINQDAAQTVSINSDATGATFATVAAQGMVLVAYNGTSWNTFTFTGTANFAP